METFLFRCQLHFQFITYKVVIIRNVHQDVTCVVMMCVNKRSCTCPSRSSSVLSAPYSETLWLHCWSLAFGATGAVGFDGCHTGQECHSRSPHTADSRGGGVFVPSVPSMTRHCTLSSLLLFSHAPHPPPSDCKHATRIKYYILLC